MRSRIDNKKRGKKTQIERKDNQKGRQKDIKKCRQKDRRKDMYRNIDKIAQQKQKNIEINRFAKKEFIEKRNY